MVHVFLMQCNGDAGMNHSDDKLMTGGFHGDGDKDDVNVTIMVLAGAM